MRKAILLLTALGLVLATAGVAMAQNGNATQYTDRDNSPPPMGRWHWGKMRGPFCRGFGPQISVSDEFKEKVINIAESDPDVQNLLNAGYENMQVRPVIRATVQGNGDVVFRATEAIVTLNRDWSRALVQVDLEAGKVTKIVTMERTVIEKS